MEGTSDGCKLVLGALDSEGTKLGCRKKGERKVESIVKREHTITMKRCTAHDCQTTTTYRSTCAGNGRF